MTYSGIWGRVKPHCLAGCSGPCDRHLGFVMAFNVISIAFTISQTTLKLEIAKRRFRDQTKTPCLIFYLCRAKLSGATLRKTRSRSRQSPPHRPTGSRPVAIASGVSGRSQRLVYFWPFPACRLVFRACPRARAACPLRVGMTS
jgi:hypothetical protein